MTSQINPNLINTAYPVAGQDNNTQGFRDNFTFIKNNFQYAAAEITNLQANSISSGAINDLSNTTLYGVKLQNQSQQSVALGGVSSSANINYASGSFQTLTLTANTTANIVDVPAVGSTAVINLIVTANAASNVAVPYTLSISNIGTGNINSGMIGLSGNTFSFPRNGTTSPGTYAYQLFTRDNGTSYFVTPLTPQLQPLNAASEDLASTANVNLAVGDSYFSTGGAETATLPAGVNGQVKVLAMYADGGDMVITVENAGWKTSGSGTITFGDIGDACTLKYINSKWFCIGNNGCAFA